MTLSDYIKENEIKLNSHQKIVLEKSKVLDIPIEYIMDFFNTTEEEDLKVIINNPTYYYKLDVVGTRYHNNDQKLVKKIK